MRIFPVQMVAKDSKLDDVSSDRQPVTKEEEIITKIVTLGLKNVRLRISIIGFFFLAIDNSAKLEVHPSAGFVEFHEFDLIEQ